MAFNIVLLTSVLLNVQSIIVLANAEDKGSGFVVPESSDSPYETQTAQCTITSGEIEASAQASISKTLVGVCGTDEMLAAFRKLETKMLEEIAILREMIRDPSFKPLTQYPSNYKTIKRDNTQPENTESKSMLQQETEIKPQTNNSSTKKSMPATSDIVFPVDEEEDSDSSYNNRDPMRSGSGLVNNVSSNNTSESLKSRLSSADQKFSQRIAFKPIDEPAEKKFLTGGLRDYEVYRFNNTVISSGDAKVFKYFWKIDHFKWRIRTAHDINKAFLSSAVFVISGLNLRLQASIGTTSDGDMLYVQLEQLPLYDAAVQKSPNVILLSGKTYDQVETSMLLRHKIVILNQDEPFSDLISSDLTNTNQKFATSIASVTNETYLKDDKLLIKVIIFL